MAVDIFGDENLCIKVYDPNEPDVSKKLIAVYDNPWKASKKLGIGASNVRHKCISKKRIHSPSLNKEVSLRFGTKVKKVSA